MKNIKSILKGIEIGYELEIKDKKEFSDPFDLHLYIATMHADDISSSESVAIHAGRLMAYFKDFDKARMESSAEDIKRIDEYNDFLKISFASIVKNAMYWADIGK